MKWYWKFLVLLLIISFIVGMAWWESIIRKPYIIRHYAEVSKKIARQDERDKLRKYVEGDSKWLSIPEYEYNANTSQPRYIPMWRRLLIYLNQKVNYTKENIIRHEDSVEILNYGLGRCGEFSIAYTALCLAFNIRARLCVCLSDHMWTEVYIQVGLTLTSNSHQPSYVMDWEWMHVDPTEQVWNNPYMYMRDWGKDFGGHDKIYAIEDGKIEEITERYVWKI